MRFTRCSAGSSRPVHRWVQVMGFNKFEFSSYTLDLPVSPAQQVMSSPALQKPRARYSAPKSAVGKFIWRQKMWVEATFALSMLERWEKIMVGELDSLILLCFVLLSFVSDGEPVTLSLLAALLFLGGVAIYLPHHIQFLARRARFYLLGNERESFYAEWPPKSEL